MNIFSTATPSLPEAYRSIPIPTSASFFRKLIAFSGPGYLVAVGYMDPGNWATDLAGGAQFGYALLFVILLSSVVAILLQHLALKLGVATGKDIAQMCRDTYPKPIRILLWLAAELMIIACDLAEVIGSAIALTLLFHIPIVLGVLITAGDVLLLLFLQNKGFRYLEAFVLVLIATIIACFGFEIFLSRPEVIPLLKGFIPTFSLIGNKDMLYISLGIIGATVMPHNLFLHSSVVQTRRFEKSSTGKKEAIRFATFDSIIALTLAFFVNAAILIVAAATFYTSGNTDVADIEQAFYLFAPLLGSALGGIFFAVALLAAGQNSTLTGTLAGQIIMEGFLNLRIKPWLRRIVTRLLAIAPALVVIVFFSGFGLGKLLVLSQVVLSVQLPFVVVPLVLFTASREKMGEFVNKAWLTAVASLIAVVLIILNVWLIYSTLVL